MRATAKQLASALVDATQGASEAQTQQAAASLVEHLRTERRVHLVPRVIRALDAVWRERFGASRVRVSSAHPLPKAEVAKLMALAPGADFEATVNPALIGGAIVRLDDRLMDGSTAGTLKRLETMLQSD